MARKSPTQQPSLFDAEPPRVTPCPIRMIELQGLPAGIGADYPLARRR